MKKIIAITAATLAIAGCSNMSTTEQRTLSGASIGAVAGGVGAAIFHGNPIWGAVGGAASGYVYDAYKKDQASEYNAGYNAGKNNKPANNTKLIQHSCFIE
jgi:osmotically inducible lipoprotein OsmB